jgi:quinol monooxygenase YgiN
MAYVSGQTLTKKGTGPQLVETIRAFLPETRNQDGYQSVEVATNPDDADNLVLVERWPTRQHYENDRQERGDLDTWPETLTGPPSIRYFDLTIA